MSVAQSEHPHFWALYIAEVFKDSVGGPERIVDAAGERSGPADKARLAIVPHQPEPPRCRNA